jgi:putative phage-type endonuclease
MNSDIVSVLDDIIENWNNYEVLTEEELFTHTASILKCIYKPKEIYDHYIRQHIYYKLPHVMKYNNIIFKESEKMKKELVKQVVELQKIPLPVQRSDEWFAFRKSRITASELATIFNANSFMTKDELVLSKCGYPQEMDAYALEICQHGVIFEPVATLLYEQRNNTTVIEFGCLPHAELDYIAASPDGITPDGIMLEIKCPMKREIIGIPRIYYWYQMQLQLEVADLNRCDFLECDIGYYANEKEFLEDLSVDLFKTNASNLEKGVIIEYYNNKKKHYIYYEPGKEKNIDKQLELLKIWWEEQIDIVLSDDNNDYLRTIYWHIKLYSCITIYRDREWFKTTNPIIKDFWTNEVVPVREDPDKINVLLNNRTIKDNKKTKSKKAYFNKNKSYLIDDS